MFTAIVLGIAQGARHSIEPDHLAAVSVLVGESQSARRSMWLGAVWGLGHTLSLTAMSIAVVAFGAALPDAADRVFTLVVASILIALGLRSLWHSAHSSAPRRARSAVQALIVGMIHGLAGSSALTALVFASLPTTAARLFYIALFGVGSIIGMAVVSGTAGIWLQRIQHPTVMRLLHVVIALASIAIGVFTAVEAIRNA
jgi:hypothetical protein